jgi:hypothetical protein
VAIPFVACAIQRWIEEPFRGAATECRPYNQTNHAMTNLLPILLCLLLLPVSVAGGKISDQLPGQIRSTLNKRFPGWRFSEVSDDVQRFFKDRWPDARPNLISGDFDGNGQTDYAMLIEHTNFVKTGKSFTHVVEQLAFLKKGTSYKLYILDKNTSATLELYITLAGKGEECREFSTQRKFTYPNDSISLSYFEKAGGTYIYRGGRFKYVIESD